MAKKKKKKKAAKKRASTTTASRKKKKKTATRKTAARTGATRKKTTRKTRARVRAVPAGFNTVSVHLMVNDGNGALAFYQRAFGATESARMTGPNGEFMHGAVRIGDSTVMIGEEMPGGPKAPTSLGGSPCVVSVYVKDADDFFIRAAQAGARVTQPLADQFWGDRYGQLVDPFGHTWAVASHIEDVSPREMQKRLAAMATGADG